MQQQQEKFYFYYDELRDTDGKPQIGGRIVTAAAQYDQKSGLVRFGATLFRKDMNGEMWNRKNHRRTAEGRLDKCPNQFHLKIDEADIARIRKNAMELQEDEEEMERIRQSYRERIERLRKKGVHVDPLEDEELVRKVRESHVRDLVVKELRKQLRRQIFNQGVKGGRCLWTVQTTRV